MISRLLRWIKSHIYSAKDPVEEIDNEIDNLQEDLNNIKEAIADITTQKKKLEIHCSRMNEKLDNKKDKSKSLILEGNESEAEYYIKQKIKIENQIENIEEQISEIEEIQENLINKKDNLQDHINDLKIKRSSFITKKQSAEAEIKAMETLSEYNDDYEIEKNMNELIHRTQRLKSESTDLYNNDYAIDEENVNKELEKIAD